MPFQACWKGIAKLGDDEGNRAGWMAKILLTNARTEKKNREAAIITEDLQMENQTKERSYRV